MLKTFLSLSKHSTKYHHPIPCFGSSYQEIYPGVIPVSCVLLVEHGACNDRVVGLIPMVDLYENVCTHCCKLLWMRVSADWLKCTLASKLMPNLSFLDVFRPTTKYHHPISCFGCTNQALVKRFSSLGVKAEVLGWQLLDPRLSPGQGNPLNSLNLC